MTLVKILALVMVVSVMLGAGLQLDPAHLGETLRNYRLMTRALIANFIIVPAIAVFAVRYFQVEPAVAIGIVLMSIAPGVPFLVNFAGRKSGGSLSLALTISFCFSALSVVTIPLTVALLDEIFVKAPVPKLPISQFLTTLVGFQLIPLLLGAVLSPRLPRRTRALMGRLLSLLFAVAALALIILIFPRLVSSVSSVAGSGHLVMIAALGLISIAVGWLFGGSDVRYRRTLALATLMRNVGLCALLGASIDAPLVLPTVFTYLIVTFVLSLPLRLYFARTRRSAPAHG